MKKNALSLFLLLLASKNNLTINEFPLKVKNRANDNAKGGGSFYGKIKFFAFLHSDENQQNIPPLSRDVWASLSCVKWFTTL